MTDPTRILVICTGNVCRSPLPERLLQRCFGERAVEQRGHARARRLRNELELAHLLEAAADSPDADRAIEQLARARKAPPRSTSTTWLPRSGNRPQVHAEVAAQIAAAVKPEFGQLVRRCSSGDERERVA